MCSMTRTGPRPHQREQRITCLTHPPIRIYEVYDAHPFDRSVNLPKKQKRNEARWVPSAVAQAKQGSLADLAAFHYEVTIRIVFARHETRLVIDFARRGVGGHTPKVYPATYLTLHLPMRPRLLDAIRRCGRGGTTPCTPCTPCTPREFINSPKSPTPLLAPRRNSFQFQIKQHFALT